MKKVFLKSMLLLCALIVGSNVVWGEEIAYTLTISPSDFNTTSYAANNNTKTSKAICTTDDSKKMDVSWTSNQVMKNSSNIQFQKNKGYIYNDTNLGTVTNINITSTAGGYTKNYGTEVNPTSGTSTGSGKGYFRIKENNTATGSVSSIVITFKFTIPTVSFNSSGVVAGNTLDLNNLFSSNSGGNVTYTITEGDTYGSIGGDGHTLTGLDEGDVTVKASQAQNGIYAPYEITTTITVASASSPNAEISVSSLNFSDVEVGNTKNMTFTITPANLTGSLSIVCDNDKYTISPNSIAQDVTEATEITVTAAPTALNNDMSGTITISGGGITSKMVNLTASPYQVANVTLNASNGVIQEGGVTKTSITSRIGSSATLTAVPSDGYVFDSWTIVGATPTTSSAAETEFTFTNTTVVLTANFILDPKEYVTLADEIPTPSENGSYSNPAVEIEEDGYTWVFKGYAAKDLKTLQIRAATSGGESYIKLPELPGAIQTIVFSVTSGSGASKGATTTTTQLSLRLGEGTTNATVVATSGSTASSTKTIDLTAEPKKYSTGYITANGSIRIWDITVSYLPAEDAEVNITSVKYATFSDYVARDFSGSGITVYKAACDGSKVTLTAIADGIVPAYEGVVLFSNVTKTDEPIPAATTTGTGDFSDNALLASDGSVTGDGSTIFALGVGKTGTYKDKVGFYPVEEDVTIPAGKAYLTYSGSSAPSMLRIEDEADVITNIENVEASEKAIKFIENGKLYIKKNNVVYDMMGTVIR